MHRWTDVTTGNVYHFTTKECFAVLGLTIERLTEHVKRFHSRRIQQSVDMGTPWTDFIRPNPNYVENSTMSLEQKIEELTAAVKALTEQFVATGTKEVAPVTKAAVVAPTPAKAKKEPPPPPAEPEVSIEDMKAKVTEVKDKFGAPEAKALIAEYGKQVKLADVTDPAAVKALYDAAVAKLEEDDEGV